MSQLQRCPLLDSISSEYWSFFGGGMWRAHKQTVDLSALSECRIFHFVSILNMPLICALKIFVWIFLRKLFKAFLTLFNGHRQIKDKNSLIMWLLEKHWYVCQPQPIPLLWAYVECSRRSHEAVLNSRSSVIAWGQRRQMLYLLTAVPMEYSSMVCEQQSATSHWTLNTSVLFVFYRTLIEHTKALDPTRPVTYITDSDYARDKGVSLYSFQR